LDNEEGPEEGVQSLSGISGVDLQSDFDSILASTSHHFFVDIDSSGPLVAEEIVGLDPIVTNWESITQFLTLPTITTRANPRRRTTDPLVDFTRSVMLTSDVYLDADSSYKREEFRQPWIKREARLRRLSQSTRDY
jgi:hypothetical protein